MKDLQFVQWLLDAQIPSIRYLTLRYLLDRPETDSDLQAAFEGMKSHGPIPAILAEQTETGSWAGERSYYTPKYTSTHWSMMLLAELAADQTDLRLKRGADFMLADTRSELKQRFERETHGISCFWGNILRYALHCGNQDDPRLRDVIDALAHDALRADWRCRHNDELPCAWGAARALWGLAALPSDLRSPDVDAAIQSGLSFLLEEHSLHKANYPTPEKGKVHPMWLRLNFPLFYQADILFVLRTLADLEALNHPGAGPALEWLSSRRNTRGHWRGASPYRQRTWKELGDRSETDRWVSLQAALVLQSL